MDELGACLSTYVLLCLMLFVFDTATLLFMLWLFIMIMDEVMEFVLIK